jgi:putative spermidine/putrescine transport system ATP-binding protein
MSYLVFQGINKSYDAVSAVSDFDLSVERGELVALLGPSGCGKTTSLRMLAGFVSASSGSILLDGRDITAAPSYSRNTGMVFQGYALFPHMTVAQNVAFGLEMRNFAKAEITRRVQRSLERVRLSALADRLPRQLSGGQQQRVALARAMVIDPAVLLLDEPLSALDARLRHEVRAEIRQLQRETGLTTLIVTHDQDEALSMADRLVIMNKGRIEQTGKPAEVYENPATRFVAEFMGKSNFLQGRVIENGRFRCAITQNVLVCDTGTHAPGEEVMLSFRPERAHIANDPPDSDEPCNVLSGRLLTATYLGQSIEVSVAVADDLTINILLPNSDARLAAGLEPGRYLSVCWRPGDSRLLAV